MLKKVWFPAVMSFLFGLVVLPSFAHAAKLSIDPATKDVKVGDTFSVNVVLNTEGVAVDGVDVHYLNFDIAKLEVVGTSITAGTLFSQNQLNTVNNTTGKVDFGQIAQAGTTYTGSGTLATVNFRAKAEGTANITFNYTAGTTTDCNVASDAQDLLNGVTNGSISITPATVATAAATATASTDSTTTTTTASTDTTVDTSSNTTTTAPVVTTTTEKSGDELVSTGPSTELMILSIILVGLVCTWVFLRTRKHLNVHLAK
jgi:hypothetical protein